MFHILFQLVAALNITVIKLKLCIADAKSMWISQVMR